MPFAKQFHLDAKGLFIIPQSGLAVALDAKPGPFVNIALRLEELRLVHHVQSLVKIPRGNIASPRIKMTFFELPPMSCNLEGPANK
jgi:hypothetical protein